MVSYEKSIENLNFALTLTDDPEVVNDIRKNLAWAHSCQGEKLFREAITLEDHRSHFEETQRKLEAARKNFEKAKDLDAKYAKQFQKTVMKIAGNKLFNEAANLEREAKELLEKGLDNFDEQDWRVLTNNCNEALVSFKKAEKEFAKAKDLDGDLRQSLEKVATAVSRTSESVLWLKKIQLVQATEKLTFTRHEFDEEEYLALVRRLDSRVAKLCECSQLDYEF